VTDTRRGHRTLPHTADLIVEAWGDRFSTCAEEAATGLLEICVGARPSEQSSVVKIESGRPTDLLAAILDEVVYTLDTSDLVPVGVELTEMPGGAVELRFGLAAREAVQSTGAVPKAIVMLESPDEARPGPARCRFLVDV
jgi:SHS2 domain-containing protein